MCTALFAFGVHPRLLFFLAFNRDEFLERPTESVHWWKDSQDEIFAGRDALRKGTWLGLTRAGRFAFLTNVREAEHNQIKGGLSRGDLPVQFLKSQKSPIEYLESIQIKEHNGFNLVVGDLTTGQVAYLTNRGLYVKPQELPNGLYGLSNGALTSSWPKVDTGKSHLKDLLSHEGLNADNFPWGYVSDTIMQHSAKVEDVSKLPQTGMGNEVEHELSSIFISPSKIMGASLYGTRSQTVITAWGDGVVEYREATIHYEQEEQPPTKSIVHHKLHVPLTRRWQGLHSKEACHA